VALWLTVIHLRALFLIAFLLLALWAVVLMAPRAVAHVSDPDGREVFLGDWAGLVECESRGDANELNHGGSGAAGLFQFMPSTWRAVATQHGKDALAQRHPGDVTAAQQLRQAIRLRDMRGGGLSHWVCGGYGSGDGWVTVYDEAKMPKHPRRCARSLHENLGAPRKVARSVCGD